MNTSLARCPMLAALTLTAALLVGCSTTAATDPGSESSTATTAPEATTPTTGAVVDVVDLEGTPVPLPAPDQITSIIETAGGQGVLGTAILFGHLDAITGTPAGRATPWIFHAYPQVADIPDYGSFDNVNIEAVVQANPDVIIAPQRATAVIDTMRDLDLPVLVSGLPSDNDDDVFGQMYDRMDLIARLTGSQERAADYHEWALNLLELVAKRVADIPDEERVTVLAPRSEFTQVYGNNAIWGAVTELAGGINLAGDVTPGTGKMWADMDAEQLVAWNPQMIFQINLPKDNDEILAAVASWNQDTRFNSMQVFSNQHIYVVPAGLDSWSSVIEAPLGVLWMAQIMYPDLFTDIDVKAQAQDFYSTFLDYDLTDEDWLVMAPQPQAAAPNGLIP